MGGATPDERSVEPTSQPYFFDCKTDVVGLAAIAAQLTVDRPLTALPVKTEGACDHRRVRCSWKTVELHERGIETVISHGWTINDDLQYLLPLTGLSEHVPSGPRPSCCSNLFST